MQNRVLRRHDMAWHTIGLILGLGFVTFGGETSSCADDTPRAPLPYQIASTSTIEPVWAGHRVGFALLTTPDRQYAAYYDADRQMTVASREGEDKPWTIRKLPTHVRWDSHNYVTMALDRQGQLHVSGNMHCVPLIYFRTTRPGDVTSLEQVGSMTGENERRCTYPKFLYDPEGRLLFTYRDGGSGNGNQIWNRYDEQAATWSRLLDTPLFDGQGRMNAYFQGPTRGPDGYFHVCWVWRDTPDCATNHDLSYARSRDLIHWEKSDGTPYELPIRLTTGEIVDPVPAGGGIINSGVRLAFDHEGRVVLSYFKYDADGKTQIHNARRESDGWKIYQATDWDYRWDFRGGGSMTSMVGLGAIDLQPDGRLLQRFGNVQDGSTLWRLDPETLRPIAKAARPVALPRAIGRRESTFPGVGVRTTGDLATRYAVEPVAGGAFDLSDGNRWLLRWETRGSNNDRPFPGDVPPPSMLKVYHLRRGN